MIEEILMSSATAAQADLDSLTALNRDDIDAMQQGWRAISAHVTR